MAAVTGVTHAAPLARTLRRIGVGTLPPVFAAMFFLGLAFSTRSFNNGDEGWFLQVIARMRDGEFLYRDISYGAGPLPAYLTYAATYVASLDIFALKLLMAAAFAATATLAWAIGRRLGLERPALLLVVAAVASFAPPLQQAPYASLATTFTLAALLAALVAIRGDSPVAALAGGAACALAFCSKQNVGLYGLAALILSLVLARRLRGTAQAVGAFVLVTCVVLLPVVAEGAFGKYVEYGFTGKGGYLHAPGQFAATLTGVSQVLTDVRTFDQAEAAYWTLGFFLPFVALGGLFAVRWDDTADTLALFAAASAATLYPRFDTVHVAEAAPMFVLFLAYVLHQRRRELHHGVFAVVVVWVAAAVALMITLPARLARSPEADLSTLPHLRGTFMRTAEEARWRTENTELLAAAQGERQGFLLLVPDAGFRYLMSGLRNPTPFDYPLVTTFGRNGQQEVIDALAAGRITRVCMGDSWYGLEPSRLVRYVRTTMQPARKLDFCRLYEPRRG